jgi:hypothetical protein
MLSLFDFVTEKGQNDILDWTATLQKPDRARLEQKLLRLTQISHELARATHLLAGPVRESIWKLRVNASVMLRPHLCRGPVNNHAEYTLLLGAIEKGDRLPEETEERALRRRSEILSSPAKRRVQHGQLGQRDAGTT